MGFNINVYLEKEGWYKTDRYTEIPITDEEGMALYEQYGVLPYDYSNEEYIRDFSAAAVWLVITENDNENIPSRSHIFYN